MQAIHAMTLSAMIMTISFMPAANGREVSTPTTISPACLDNEAFQGELHAEASAQTFVPEAPADPSPSMTGEFAVRPSPIADYVVSLETNPGRHVRGTPSAHAALVLECVAPYAAVLVVDPLGRTYEARASRTHEAIFPNVDTTQEGTWSVLAQDGGILGQFTTPSPLPTDAADGPLDVTYYHSRTIYEAPATNYYARSQSQWGSIMSRYWTMKDDWSSSGCCDPVYHDVRSGRFEFTVKGPTDTLDGAYYPIAFQHEAIEVQYGPTYYNSYAVANAGVYVDTTATTKINAQPTQPAASFRATGSNLAGTLAGAAVDLAVSYIDSVCCSWWVQPIASTFVKYVMSTSEVPYTACTNCLANPWRSNAPAGGILYNYGDYLMGESTEATLPIYKQQSCATQTVHLTAKARFHSWSRYYGTAPNEEWGAYTPFSLYPPAGYC